MIRLIGQKTDHLRGLFVQVTGFTCTTIDEIDEGVSPTRAGGFVHFSGGHLDIYRITPGDYLLDRKR